MVLSFLFFLTIPCWNLSFFCGNIFKSIPRSLRHYKPKWFSFETQLKKNYYNPTTTNGWEELKNYYHLPENVEVNFDFFGIHVFKVTSFKEIESYIEIQIFHSRSLIHNKIKYFDIQIRKSDLEWSQMVYLTNLNKSFISSSYILLTVFFNSLHVLPSDMRNYLNYN